MTQKELYDGESEDVIFLDPRSGQINLIKKGKRKGGGLNMFQQNVSLLWIGHKITIV